MPTILRRLPFFEGPTAVVVAGNRIPIKPYQIIVWVSVATRRQGGLGPNALRLPAILDTGLSHNFAVREEHLIEWGGVPVQVLPTLGHARVSGLSANLLDGDVWLHPNRPGERDEFLDRPAFRLELHRGIAVFPRETPHAPRLPLLGLRGLRRTQLQLAIDSRSCRVSLRTPWRFWPSGW